MLDQELSNLGLSPEEAKVYLAVLELGGSFASSIARKAKIPRVNCYYVLENLRKKGLISIETKKDLRFFIAEPPQVIVNQVKDQYEKAKKILPELLSITNLHAFKPIIRSYEGLDGIKNIFEQTLTAKSEVLGYTNLEFLGNLLPDYLPQYTRSLIKNKIKVRWLSPSTAKAREFIKNYYPKNFPTELVEVLYVNAAEFNFETQVAIYGNTVAFMSLDPNESIGVVMESKVYANTQRAIFNLSWLGATAFVAR